MRDARSIDEHVRRDGHLERPGYVVMCKPPLSQHGAAGNLADWIEEATQSSTTAQTTRSAIPIFRSCDCRSSGVDRTSAAPPGATSANSANRVCARISS
jgi:hypothetical protein